MVDLYLPGQIIRENTQRVSLNQLPQHAQDRGIGESAPIRQGVRELEALVARTDRASVRLSPPGTAIVWAVSVALVAAAAVIVWGAWS
ncbi:hypothetical protein AB0G64_36175 [Streptomyces longwoodensis]|uniref:hypothetical protein n=1 Tax=Streptomyces longwoodensis TaxID=68231 RepID=UPI0033D84220